MKNLKEQSQDHSNVATPSDSIDRRGFLRCMAWVGTGVLWSFRGGIPTSSVLGAPPATNPINADFSFVQISDSHIGFSREPNKDVTATLRTAIERINALSAQPEMLIHTGDLTHLAKASEFDTVSQVLRDAKVGNVFYVPGEHDVFTDEGKQYLNRFGKNTRGTGWHSFNHKGVHFVGLVNVANLKPGGLGALGHEQLDWLKADLEGIRNSTPGPIYAHGSLWTIFPGQG